MQREAGRALRAGYPHHITNVSQENCPTHKGHLLLTRTQGSRTNTSAAGSLLLPAKGPRSFPAPGSPGCPSAPRRRRAGPSQHLPLHAALQVGHGALPARTALVAAVAETLHEPLLEGAALPCNRQPGPRYRRARAPLSRPAECRGERGQAGARPQEAGPALPHRSDPAGRRPCPAAAV